VTDKRFTFSVLDIVYILAMSGLTVFGLHRFFLLARALSMSTQEPGNQPLNQLANGEASMPRVTVQLPIYNEQHVVNRLIDAVCNLDYDLNNLEIQVLDDSTDQTTRFVDDSVRAWQNRGYPIKIIRRSNREGYKAGALAAGLVQSTGQFIAMFDADFIPAPSFLKEALREFTDDGIGMVQARWAHYNRHESLLTEAQAILLDGHFIIEQRARWGMGVWFNFNGTAGVWRRTCIDEAGGWTHETLTEDLDLSYRAQMKGWSFKYVNHLSVSSELPTAMSAFRSQQHRWAKGSIQVAQKLMSSILSGPFSIRRKFEASCHLLANLNYLFVTALCLCLPLIIVGNHVEVLFSQVGHHLFLTGALCFGLFYVGSQINQQPLYRAFLLLPVVFALGLGLCLNNTRAVIEALLGHTSAFIRTPKLGEDSTITASTAAYKVPTSKITRFVETVLLGLYIACLIYCISSERWHHLPLILLFCAAFSSHQWTKIPWLRPRARVTTMDHL
jgi:cellulose synthase/poly-beta-1,6-N-acetylglucosamine synthase-like glycosyltransferase